MSKGTLTKAEAARRSVILGELAKLSHNGWADARPGDYQALESELATLPKPARAILERHEG